MRSKVVTAVSLLLLAVPSLAAAQDLGEKGVAVFSAERLMGIAGTHVGGDVDGDATLFGFAWQGSSLAGPYTVPRVAFDYFIIDHLSLGGTLAYANFDPDGGNSVSHFLFEPRVGYHHAFGRVVSIWPRGGLVYHSSSVEDGGSESGFGLDLDCPFVFTPRENFAFQVGPTFDIDFTGEVDPEVGPDYDQTYRTFGIFAGLLGWF